MKELCGLKLFGIPCHVCNEEFFKFIVVPFGEFMHCDDVTTNQVRMVVARTLIRTRCFSLINETINVKIVGNMRRVRVVEDTQGPLRVCASINQQEDDDD